MPLKRTTSQLMNPMTNPAFPFVVIVAGYSVLLLWELWKLSNEEIPYILGLPLIILTAGGMLL